MIDYDTMTRGTLIRRIRELEGEIFRLENGGNQARKENEPGELVNSSMSCRGADKENMYRQLFEAQTDLVIQIDTCGKLVFVNTPFCDLLQKSEDELLGEEFLSYVYADDRLSVRKIIGQVCRGHRRQIELRANTRLGVRWLSLSLNRMYDVYKDIHMIILAGRDITEKKKGALACVKSERKYRALFENAGDAIMMMKLEGRLPHVVQANTKALDLFGFPKEELLGKSPIELSPNDQPGSSRALEQMKTALFSLMVGEVYSFDWFFKKKDGSLIECNVSMTLIETGAEEIYMIVARDITERKLMEARLRHSEKMQAIGQLAGGVAHDFNNQLAGILGYADLIFIEANDNQSVRNYAQSILSASRHAADLVNKLLAFARRGQHNPVIVDIHEVLDEVIGLLERSIHKSITIERLFRASNSCVMGDPAYLQNAFLNLGINSRDAMPDGGVIRFETQEVENNQLPRRSSCNPCIRIRVSDTGVGMKQEVIEHIFEPFFTTKDEKKGTGLGLAAMYETITKTNGTVKVSSTEKAGTCFDVFLPLAPVATKKKTKVKRPAFVKRKESYRVIIVDDEPVVCRAGAMMLKVAGHEVVEFIDPREALRYFNEHRQSVDLVVTDIIMPHIDGEELIRRLRDINPEIRAVFTSGFRVDGDIADGWENGATEILKKPFQTSELIAVVERVMGK